MEIDDRNRINKLRAFDRLKATFYDTKQTTLHFFTGDTTIRNPSLSETNSQTNLSPASKSNCLVSSKGTVVRKLDDRVFARAKTVSNPAILSTKQDMASQVFNVTYGVTHRNLIYCYLHIGNYKDVVTVTVDSPRALRGLAILSQGDTVKRINQTHWTVKSQFGDNDYVVMSKGKLWLCSCPDYQKREMDCKHIFSVKFSIKLKDRIEEDTKREIITVNEDVVCPQCGSSNIIKRGRRHNKNGDVQVWGCKDCEYRFTVDKGFSHMKTDPKAIMSMLDLYFKGLSLRKICDHLKQFYDITVNPTTPMRWIKKYLKLLSKYSEEHKADVGRVWHSDEMTLFIKKEGEEKYYEWIWNVMDAETRFLLACRVTKTRFIKDARKPLKDAKKIADKRPDVIVTDGLQAYNKAIPKEFYDKKAEFKNPHYRLKDFETKPNNNIVERLNGTFRERQKVFRGISTNKGADEYVDAMQVYYNYLRPHQGIHGMTPAQMANIPIDLSGNRWETMIALATMQTKIKKIKGCKV